MQINFLRVFYELKQCTSSIVFDISMTSMFILVLYDVYKPTLYDFRIMLGQMYASLM